MFLFLFTTLLYAGMGFKTCGIYEATGRLRINNQHQFILDINGGTREKQELLLLTDKVEDVMSKMGKVVQVEVRVLKEQKEDSNIVLLQKLSLSDSKKQGAKFVKNQSCN